MIALARNCQTILLCVASFVTFAYPVSAQAPKAKKLRAITLKVGDPAPAFAHGTWLKGEPLTAFAKGKIYVLEFWGTNCGACIVAIPHVTELAKKYAGKVTFIGVNVLETGKSPADIERKVAAFVKKQGEAMDYLVCRDTADKVMEKTWLAAAGDRAIPATFVVDAAGRLAWKGHPTAMASVLEQMVTGRFDAAATEAVVQANEKSQKAIGTALRAKEWQKVLDLVAAYKPTSKDDVGWAESSKFQALLHVDEKAAEAMYDRALGNHAEAADLFAILIANEEGLSKAWYSKAIPVLKDAAKEEQGLLGLLSRVQFRAGEFESAAKSKALEIEDFKGKISRILENHPEMDVQLKEHLAKLEAELKAYQAASRP
jgi:thiol-disulfide isomerase/thioredoxin